MVKLEPFSMSLGDRKIDAGGFEEENLGDGSRSEVEDDDVGLDLEVDRDEVSGEVGVHGLRGLPLPRRCLHSLRGPRAHSLPLTFQ